MVGLTKQVSESRPMEHLLLWDRQRKMHSIHKMRVLHGLGAVLMLAGPSQCGSRRQRTECRPAPRTPP